MFNNAHVLSNRNSVQVQILDFIKHQYSGSQNYVVTLMETLAVKSALMSCIFRLMCMKFQIVLSNITQGR